MILNTATGTESSLSRRNTIVCLCLFAAAFSVRFLVWQNNRAAMDSVQYVVTDMYKGDAKILLDGNVQAFLTGPDPPSDATILEHPPGYPLFIAGVYYLFGEKAALQVVQMLLNSLAAVLVFFFALFTLDFRTAVIAGSLTALSPQFAYHSGIILPDELSVIPLLFAVYFMARAFKERQLWQVAVVGFSIGISCWLRANALLLPIFFAGLSLILLPKQIRVRSAVLLLAGFLLTISPVTIRNYVVFHSFLPLSVGAGTTFIEGLADSDPDGRFNLPSTDKGVMEMDARIANRPDYVGSLYDPDGVERERERIKVGLETVREDPAWYFMSVLERTSLVFRLERVPVIASQSDEKATTAPFFYHMNLPLKYFQRLFITAVFLPLFFFGAVMLLRNRAKRAAFAVLAIVPIYYMCVQSLIHTEYRYLLPASHCLLIISSVCLSALIGWAAKLKSMRSDV